MGHLLSCLTTHIIGLLSLGPADRKAFNRRFIVNLQLLRLDSVPLSLPLPLSLCASLLQASITLFRPVPHRSTPFVVRLVDLSLLPSETREPALSFCRFLQHTRLIRSGS